MVNGLLDTNILIDYLNAVPEARTEIERYDKPAISVITWMEVMVGAPTELQGATHQFLDDFDLVELDDQIAERAVALRRSYRIKLPDAVIWASAVSKGMLLVTRDAKDFQTNDPSVRVPYSL
jgi:predicted nucleic acid-binding protein